MRIPVIFLQFRQLVIFGVHIGHDYKNVFFLSSWIFYSWYKNLFIINLYKTFLNFRFGLLLFYKCASMHRPVWFVSIRSRFSSMISCYAYVSGEVFSTYWWVNGSATNFYRIVGWNQLIARLMMLNKHYLRFKDKKKMARFYGLIDHRKRLPGGAFTPTVLNNLAAVEEFTAAHLPCVGIVDSNVPSTAIMIPVPGNDDSYVCVNFYCYMLSRSLLAAKVNFVYMWKWKIRMKKIYRRRKPWMINPTRFRNVSQFIYLYTNFYRYGNKNDFFKLFDEVSNLEFIMQISKEDAIVKWLSNTILVSKFASYTGKLFTLLDEYQFTERYEMELI